MGATESRQSLKIDPPGLAVPIKGGCVCVRGEGNSCVAGHRCGINHE